MKTYPVILLLGNKRSKYY